MNENERSFIWLNQSIALASPLMRSFFRLVLTTRVTSIVLKNVTIGLGAFIHNPKAWARLVSFGFTSRITSDLSDCSDNCCPNHHEEACGILMTQNYSFYRVRTNVCKKKWLLFLFDAERGKNGEQKHAFWLNSVKMNKF